MQQVPRSGDARMQFGTRPWKEAIPSQHTSLGAYSPVEIAPCRSFNRMEDTMRGKDAGY